MTANSDPSTIVNSAATTCATFAIRPALAASLCACAVRSSTRAPIFSRLANTLPALASASRRARFAAFASPALTAGHSFSLTAASCAWSASFAAAESCAMTGSPSPSITSAAASDWSTPAPKSRS